VKENPSRTEFVGISVRLYQLGAFVLSGFFLGVAGSLYCGLNQNVFPDYAHWAKSTEMIVVCLLGGVHNFLGPIVGSVVYIFLDKSISLYTEYWPLILGLIIVVLVLFLKDGIVGTISVKITERLDLRAKG
jgi:branched-chain amino acid transport system permease protein